MPFSLRNDYVIWLQSCFQPSIPFKQLTTPDDSQLLDYNCEKISYSHVILVPMRAINRPGSQLLRANDRDGGPIDVILASSVWCTDNKTAYGSIGGSLLQIQMDSITVGRWRSVQAGNNSGDDYENID
ncbi:hypothetical protein L2E82_10509 [Cichorium intybus]|uniref:Uncharacterized protein n=1 Tax=Cichorium intybus TaxID=13427 RepID=A0ACB9GAW9_CICIN|nr:hypothetical protein L2E82_10509 [Cichorium intybus]